MTIIKLKAVKVPNFVFDTSGRKYAISELTADELTALGDSFKINLFLKAKKKYVPSGG